MRKLALLILLLLPARGFGYTQDQVKTATWDLVSGTQDLIFDTAPTAGCTVAIALPAVADKVLGVEIDMAFAATPITDDHGNTYTVIQSSPAGHQVALIAIADNVTSGATFTITVHPDASVGDWYAMVAAKSWCGMANPSLDRSGTGADQGPQGADANVATSLATTQANEIVLVASGICMADAGVTDEHILTPTTGYTDITSWQDCNVSEPGTISWKAVTSTGIQTANWSHDDIVASTGYAGWVTAIVVLKDAVSGGTGVRRRSPVEVD